MVVVAALVVVVVVLVVVVAVVAALVVVATSAHHARILKLLWVWCACVACIGEADSALIVASRKGHVHIVELLLDRYVSARDPGVLRKGR